MKFLKEIVRKCFIEAYEDYKKNKNNNNKKIIISPPDELIDTQRDEFIKCTYKQIKKLFEEEQVCFTHEEKDKNNVVIPHEMAEKFASKIAAKKDDPDWLPNDCYNLLYADERSNSNAIITYCSSDSDEDYDDEAAQVAKELLRTEIARLQAEKAQQLSKLALNLPKLKF